MASNNALLFYLFENEVLFRSTSDLQESPVTPVIDSQSETAEQNIENVVSAVSAVGTERLAHLGNVESKSVFPELKSRVLILVNTYGKGIKSEERAFLAKVLKAVNHDIDAVDLIELDKLDSQDVSDVVRRKLADYILLFGVKPDMANLDIRLELFEPANFNGIWFLMSNSLLRIEMEESKRRDLWNALKRMFFKAG